MSEFPMGAAAVKTSFYVDDLLCGTDDTDALHTLKAEVIEIVHLTWNQRSDTLLFTFTSKPVHKSVTKRTILFTASPAYVWISKPQSRRGIK